MKKSFKAIVSILMTLVLLLGTASAAFAEGACDCGKTPVVFVDGIGGTIYSADENGNEYEIFPIESDTMTKELLTFVPVALVTAVFGGWDSLAVALDTMLCKLFAGMDCDNEGNSVLEAYPDECDEATVEEHMGDNEFDFMYDWRLDPYETVAELDAYIDEVIAATGHDKVILSAFSEGGEITLAYLDEYGSDKIEKYIGRCSAFQGLTLIGKLFTNQCSVDAGQLVNFLTTMLPTAGVSDGVTTLLSVLRYTDIYSILAGIVNTVLDNCFDTIYKGFARDVFACMPGIFGFVPAAYFDDAVDMMFGDDPQYAVLVEKLTKYHNAQVNVEQIFKTARDNGMAVVLISNYGCYPMPLIGDTEYQSDSLIDSANTSGGATFAPMGETFADNYKQVNNDGHDHLSPDGAVDASTCMFPESTWFVSNFNHWNVAENLLDWLVEFDGQPTVHDNPEFPQFLVGDPTENTVSAQR